MLCTPSVGQDAPDVHALSLKGMSPSTVPAHAASLPADEEYVMQMTRPPTIYLSPHATTAVPHRYVIVPFVSAFLVCVSLFSGGDVVFLVNAG